MSRPLPAIPPTWPTDIPDGPLHIPGRPHWRCRRCGVEWPCPTAQAELVAGYRDMKISLSLYLASQWVDCLTDLCVLHPTSGDAPSLPGLFERFFGWAELGARG